MSKTYMYKCTCICTSIRLAGIVMFCPVVQGLLEGVSYYNYLPYDRKCHVHLAN